MSTTPEWVPLASGVSWNSPPLFDFSVERRIIEDRFGTAHLLDCDSNGVGLFDAWCLRFHCGLEVALWLSHQPAARANAEVHATERDADHILFHLGVSPQNLSSWEPDACPPVRPRYLLLRRDDNNFTFEMTRFTSSCQAEAAVRMYESHGHRQDYWWEYVDS